jgi:enoyl-CoA hydratase
MDEDEVLFERRGRAGIITLNRPKALNALTLDMVRRIHPQLSAWEGDDQVALVIIRAAGDKAFCAGGDIRALYDWGRAGDPAFLAFYREEYQLNAYIKRYPKPYVALMTGITMGGGVGVSVHGSHRVATEGLTFAMPETGIGLFPDVGGTYFLPRCPGQIGAYLALTGSRLKAADALYAGIVSHFVPAENIPDLIDRLIETGQPDGAIEAMARDPGRPQMLEVRDAVDRCFSATGVSNIADKLQREDSEWAGKLADTLLSKSPTSSKITFRQIRKGAGLEFEDCMRLEYRMVNRILSGHDFFEGIRAVVVDKDQSPHWRPAELEHVTDDMVDAYFAPLVEELVLPQAG